MTCTFKQKGTSGRVHPVRCKAPTVVIADVEATFLEAGHGSSGLYNPVDIGREYNISARKTPDG
jgi:hypothetical protein